MTADWPAPRTFAARDGARLAYRVLGEGRPVVLVHGLFSTAQVAWASHGHVQPMLDAGLQLVMADLRGHGDSARPHDPSAYPSDVLATDVLDLVAHLGLADGAWDLAGYSLGGRVTMRVLALGARPRRAVAGGVGLRDVLDTSQGADMFRRVLTGEPGSFWPDSPEQKAEAFMHSIGADPVSMHLALNTQADTGLDALRAIEVPTLLLMGTEDDPDGAAELADLMVDASVRLTPGHHIGVGRSPALHEAIVDHLTT